MIKNFVISFEALTRRLLCIEILCSAGVQNLTIFFHITGHCPPGFRQIPIIPIFWHSSYGYKWQRVTVSCPSGVPMQWLSPPVVSHYFLCLNGVPLMRKEFRFHSFVENLPRSVAEPHNYREHHVTSAKNYQSTLNCPGDTAWRLGIHWDWLS